MLGALRIAGVVVAIASSASAQHPLPPRDRTLAERVALSDAVALARVALVEPGRLHLEAARALRGEVPGEFQVKRSPLDPPPYQEGDLAVFFLRGARPPFVLADEPREMIRPASEVEARRLAQAVEEVVGAGGDAERILALHVDWLEGPDAALRDLASAALVEPLPTGFAQQRARVAMDRGRSLEARRASATVAVRDTKALELLLAWIPGGASEADAAVAEVVLRRAAALRAAGTQDALERALASPQPGLRTQAERLKQRLGAR